MASGWAEADVIRLKHEDPEKQHSNPGVGVTPGPFRYWTPDLQSAWDRRTSSLRCVAENLTE